VSVRRVPVQVCAVACVRRMMHFVWRKSSKMRNVSLPQFFSSSLSYWKLIDFNIYLNFLSGYFDQIVEHSFIDHISSLNTHLDNDKNWKCWIQRRHSCQNLHGKCIKYEKNKSRFKSSARSIIFKCGKKSDNFLRPIDIQNRTFFLHVVICYRESFMWIREQSPLT